jgi:predicted DNA-binding transcriptional regulator AlpA
MRNEARQVETPGLRERLPGGDVARRLNVGRTTLWRWRQLPDFPRPVAVGKLRLYDVAQLEEWLSTRAR